MLFFNFYAKLEKQFYYSLKFCILLNFFGISDFKIPNSKYMYFEIWNLEIWNLESEILKFEILKFTPDSFQYSLVYQFG